MLAADSDDSNFSTMNTSLARLHFAGGYQPNDSKDWRSIIPAFLMAICLVGLAGNLCVISILLHGAWRGKLSMINSLILNLSLADLFLLLFSAPLRAAAYSKGVWDMGWFVCKSSDWFTHTCMAAKSLTIVVVAKACFMYVSNPAKQMNINNCTIWTILVVIWAMACLLPLPEWFFSTLRYHEGVEMCIMDVPALAQEFTSTFGKLYPLLVFCLPLLFAGMYFWKAYCRYQHRGTKTQNLRNQIRSRRLTMMLLSVAITSAIMWLPEWIAWLWVWHLKTGSPVPPQGFIALSQVLMFSISSANPFIFLVMSEEFKGFKDFWRWLTSKKPLPDPNLQGTLASNSQVISENVPSQEPLPSVPDKEKPGSSPSGEEKTDKEIPVLPDVEQFWHERDIVPTEQDNDPIPWEHGSETPGCSK
ncbi:G-protein coupled receptor 151 [Gracilinanus agilis]|uniref:G-protein coupled receptor 151 n=1 Tax=Gracilinanus agilis TaxID=191870 RepID=UPI001CFC4C5E|nr:G-protein coupled receptor 151 [Gracilinanus agilis]